MQNIQSEIERMAKRHRAVRTSRIRHIDSLIRSLGEARDQIHLQAHSNDAMTDHPTPPNDCEVRNTISMMLQNSKQAESSISSDSKELQAVLGKCLKTVDKSLPPDFSKAITPVTFDANVLDEVIVEHFLRGGRVELAKILSRETGQRINPEIFEPFMEIVDVYKGFKDRNLDPAMAWIASNAEALRCMGSKFAFQVVKMKFLQLADSSVMEAIAFSRLHFPIYAGSHMPEIQRLMGSLAFLGRWENSPYASLRDPSIWDEAVDSFARDSSQLLGLSNEMPLSVCIGAGTLALPKLLKLATVMGKNVDWTLKTAPPIQVELSSYGPYHSVFVCPVSREVASAENPPMMMQCGHVLCEHSLRKLSRGSSRFKCPYCPAEVTVHGSLRLSI